MVFFPPPPNPLTTPLAASPFGAPGSGPAGGGGDGGGGGLGAALRGPGGLVAGAVVVAAGFVLLQANESLFFLDSEQQALEEAVSEEERRAASLDLKEFEERLRQDPGDAPALVGAGKAELRLGKVREAAQRLEGALAAARGSGDAALPDTQLVLDYAAALSGMGKHAAAAGELRAQAEALAPERLPVLLLKRLQDEYSSAGQAAQAVDFFLKEQGRFRDEMQGPEQGPLGPGPGSEAGAGGAGPALPPAPAAAERPSGGSGAGGGDLGGGLGAAASGPELRLLLGRAYAAWAGHQQDALATYDAFIRDRPEDYRGYVAKGALLAQGRDFAGADRAFLQGRYRARAPAERATVDQARARAQLSQLQGAQRALK